GVALVLPPLPDPERVREVVRPDEEAVDAVERRDLARLRDCLRALDLDDADRLEALDMLTAARPVPAGAVQERDAAHPGRPVTKMRDRTRGILDAADARHDHAR